MGSIVTIRVNFLMKTNAQCPVEDFRMLWLKFYLYLTKSWCQSLLFVKEVFLHWSPVCQQNGKYGDHLSEPPYENKCSVPPGNFRMLWLDIHSYLTKASCFSLLLMQQLFLYSSPVGQKNGKILTIRVNFLMKTNAQCPLENFQILSLKFYSYLTKAWCQRLAFGESAIFTLVSYLSIRWDLSQLSYEKKYWVPAGKFSNALIKIQFIFEKSLLPEFTYSERATFTLVTCLSIKREIQWPPEWISLWKQMLSAPWENFRMLWLEIHSYVTKAWCFSLLLMQQLFLYWSPVVQKNGKYSDHLNEVPYENKCSVPR